MSNTQALIEEVKSDLSKYADAHLLDENSMYRDIVKGLKRFGNDVLTLHETMVEVKDGEAALPENFSQLYFAYFCKPVAYSPTAEIHNLQGSIIYTERHVRSREWNECEANCETITDSVIKENLYIKEEKVAEYHYGSPRLLTLGKSFQKSACYTHCRNKLIKDNPNEIVIINTTLQANFKAGHIYMMYYGLPTDSEGLVEIPDTFNGHLEEYLEYRLKRRITERLVGNNDAVNLANMLNYFATQERTALKNASNELKMGKIGAKGTSRWSRLNKLESMQYESALTK